MKKINQAISEKNSRALIELGKVRSRDGCPNPKRLDCPSELVLKAMARRSAAVHPRDVPASHVANCSPCFGRYRSFRREVWFYRGAALAATLILVVVGMRSVVRYLEESKQPSLIASGTKDLPFALEADLTGASPIRGSTTDATPLRLPARKLLVTFLLPVGLEPGEYEVRLTKATGALIQNSRAAGTLVDGTTKLLVDVDLTGLKKTEGILSIRPPGINWRSYGIFFE